MRNLVPHLAAMAVIAGCAWLALWQVERADEKRQIIERWNERAPIRLETLTPPYSLPQPVHGVGIWDPSRQILVDNQIRDQRTGVHVLTPVRLSNGRVFLVNRGWAAWPARTSSLPNPGLDGKRIEIEAEIRGVLNTPPGTGIRLGETETPTGDEWPLLVTYVEPDVLKALFGEELQPAVIQLEPAHRGHLTGDPWQVVTFGPDRHIGYALTWTSIALVVAGIWLVLTIRQARARHY